MAKFNYLKSRATSERLLEKFGQPGIIRRRGTPTGDPWNETYGDPTDQPCTLVELDYDAREVDGTLVQMEDRKVLVSTEGVTTAPTQADALVIGEREFEIISVKPASPGGVVLLWTVQAR